MIEYQKLNWVDEIKDQYGNIIRDGTPLSAKNHNRMEDGIAAAVMEVNNNSAAIREAIPSGFIKLGDLDYKYMGNSSNKIKLGECVAFVNGWKVTIPDDTIIQLNEPPITGEREDLVFLESWFDQTTGELRYRIRVVDGVDFNAHKEGLRITGETWEPYQVYGQGGGITPNKETVSFAFCSASGHVGDMGGYGGFNIKDEGLYICGDGTQKSKEQLKTYDGYVYAIPMFKIWRRNRTPFSDINPNGGNLFNNKIIKTNTNFSPSIPLMGFTEIDISENYNIINVGEIYQFNSDVEYRFLVISKNGNNNCTVCCVRGTGLGNCKNLIWNKNDRIDGLYSDIIAERDIIDLRHQVSFAGFNYQQLLEENFDKLLRGELQTKEKIKMIKTYHGIRKTPIDANTVFYASFDGTTIAEVGGAPYKVVGSSSTTTAPTGLSSIEGGGGYTYSIPNSPTDDLTIDLTIDRKKYINHEADNTIFNICGGFKQGKPTNGLIFHYCTSYYRFGIYNDEPSSTPSSYKWQWTGVLAKGDIEFIRIIVNKSTKTITLFVNGNKVYSYVDEWVLKIDPKYIALKTFPYDINVIGYGAPHAISDLSISNIDRGNVFQTLPKDFIEGYAQIAPAFNEQRNTFSDAFISEYKLEVIKSSGGNPRQYIINQANKGVWTKGDTIKLKGLSGEFISGVIDSDTATARVIKITPNIGINNTLYLNDVSKIQIGDTLKLYTKLYNNFSLVDFVVASIDVNNKTITTNYVDWNSGEGNDMLIFENTPSSSSPIVKYNGGTVLGTWSGLGTNEAIFTLGTNATFTNQDMQIEYSLNELEGQGAFNDVLTTTLGGEVNGNKMIVNGGSHIIGDFRGKLEGSLIGNPNIGYQIRPRNDLANPQTAIKDEWINTWYGAMYKLDNTMVPTEVTLAGQIAQQLISINVVEMVERKYGTIRDLDKIKWCKNNIQAIRCSWWGYSKGPNGNKANFAAWNNSDNAYALSYVLSNDSDKSTILSHALKFKHPNPQFELEKCMDKNGFVHFLVYSEPSDGVTKSIIYTDYVEFGINLKIPEGYDVLTPENTRMDSGKGNILIIRKETNEIKTLFGELDNNSNVVTYGDYVPYQGFNSSNRVGSYYLLTDYEGFLTTEGTGSPKSLSNSLYTKYPIPNINFLPLNKSTARLSDYNNNELFERLTTCNVRLVDAIVNSSSYDFDRVGRLTHRVLRKVTLSLQLDKNNKYLTVAYALVKYNNELLMLIGTSTNGTICSDGNTCSKFSTYKISGKPLIKG